MNERRRVDSLSSLADSRAEALRDPEMLSLYLQARTEVAIADHVREARTRAGLSQSALAEKSGATASDIDQLESADYAGDSLRLLHQLAAALECSVEIQLTPRAPE